MLPFSSTMADQIRFLLRSCNNSNFDSIFHELCKFVEYGSEGSILLLQTCLEQIDFHCVDVQNLQVKPDLVAAVLKCLLEKPNFSTVICEALRNEWVSDEFLEELSKVLNLSKSEKIGLGLALSDSENFKFRTIGQNFCINQIEELYVEPSAVLSHEQIQDIVMFLYRSEGLSKHVDSFTKMLSLLQQKEKFPFVLDPVLQDDTCPADSSRHLDRFLGSSDCDFEAILSEIEKEISMADIMKESGYDCTIDISRCTEVLSLFKPLNEATISQILGTIARTHTGLEESQNTHSAFCAILWSNSIANTPQLRSWNINILVDSIKQLAPETNWETVIKNFDHNGFFVPEEDAFTFLMSVYSAACSDPFPLDAVCGSLWKNAEGQLSFLRHAVSAPPEVFSFAHSARKLQLVESVHYQNGHGNQAWFCLDLLEILCQLAEMGHASSVRKIFEYPLRHLPEVLLVGVAHIRTAYNLLQSEVSSTLFPTIIRNPSEGSTNVIRQLWHANSSFVLLGFIYTVCADPVSIVRVLDICQELKIFPQVLDLAPFSFSIKLAAAASQKELINLETWLNDNLNVYKDVFHEVCVNYLKGLHPDTAVEISSDVFQHSGAVSSSNREMFQKIWKVLQAHPVQNLSPQFSEVMNRISSSQFPAHCGEEDNMPVGDADDDDIEAEANAYFHQMFSEQLSVDTMVQTLSRFKESSDNREQRIFDCMIGNLFEEYKFFLKYPERQLKIAAILFGSLIKHQLVTHLTLGIALRCVLDALRKSVDSKMFQFGTKALEQFTDRLIEWPQYCNHILQISHLRSTHSDLVSFIEHALARISSSQANSNGGNSIIVEQQQGPVPAFAENVEMNSNPLQAAPQLPPPYQIQQRRLGTSDDRLKVSAPLVTHMKPNSSASGSTLSPAPIISDSAGSLKAIIPQSQASVNSSSGTTTVSSSPGFLRPSRSITPSGVPRQPSYSTGFGAALNIETLVAAAERRDTAIEAPASEVQDKIFFIINNISSANIDAKAKEFTDILKEQYYPWFAQYMVMKRASIEPNFHDLYLKFLDKVNSRSLNKEIVKATYENCKVLLRSDLIKSSSEERSLLKNLGSWLGKFTIGRNQALRAREIDPKVLIIEAYEKGLMIAVIPFTSKVLEPCQCSLAYQPPNPWTMAILGLLVEIYNLPNLKMNLKFDIEVLFKNLGVDLKDVKPTTLLKDRTREIEGNPDFSNKDIIAASQVTNSSEGNVGSQTLLNQIELHAPVTSTSHSGLHPSAALSQYSGPIHVASNTFMDDDKMGAINISERAPSVQVQSQVNPSHTSFPMSQLLASISNISSHVVVNNKLSGLGLQMQLQRIIPVALEKAIRDTISPVVQRSVTIASQTTKELVQKDYAMEFDESRILNAAHLMVSSLARSLAHVTCKEPLRQTMSNHLRSLFQAINVGGDVLEQAVQLVTNDNLDLGCAYIEQAAAEKALQTIDGEIASFISYRRKQMENGGSAFYDAGTYTQGPFARVPEALRPKPGRLSVHQQRVYEDFVKYPLYNPSAQSPSAVPSAAGSLVPSGGSVGSVGRVYSSNSGQLSSVVPPAASGFGGVSQPSDFISEEIDPASSQFTSASSHSGANDIAFQQIVDAKTVLSSLAPPTPELHVVEPSATIKDFGSVTLPTPTTTVERLGMTNLESLSTGEALDKFQIVAQKLDACLSKDPKEVDIQGLIAEVPDIILKCVSRDEAALAVAQKVFKHLYENASNSMHVNTHLAMLAAVRDVCKLVVKELTSWIIYSDEERKFNKDITISFIRSDLLNLAEYDMHLAKLIDGGRNKAATEFAVSLIQALVEHEPGVSVSEFYNLIDALTKLAMRAGSPESLQRLVEVARSNSSTLSSLPGAAVSKEEKDRLFKDKKVNSFRGATNLDDYNVSESLMSDPSGFRDQVSAFFTEWYRISELTGTNEAACAHFILQLQQSGLLKGDDRTDHFFRVLTDLVVGHCLASEKMPPVPMSPHSSQHVSHLSFLAIDIYAKLVALVIKQIAVDLGDSNVSFFHRILVVTIKVLQKDAEEKKELFNPRPYFRIFINFLMDLISPDPLLDGINFQVLQSLANAFHALQPLKVPAFSYAWLELVSHRNFMPKLLMSSNQKGWRYFQCLLVDLFKFMEPYLRNADLGEPVQCLYRGTMRMLLVLLHDFPEFLCDYHFSFCDVIPASCVQMRNVILSAFPVNMRLPDPCTPNLKIDLLPEIEQPPRILSDVDTALRTKQLKADIDEFLKTKVLGPSFLPDLKQRLLLPPNEFIMAGTRYNVPLINSLVLYVGMQAIQQLPGKSPSHVPSAPRPMDIRLVGEAAMDIFNSLIQDLDTEGRYLFLNAAANQLRYPNNHTHYFSFVLLYLFVEADQDIIREQITRVLLERLIANRPHPWGLLITFIELIKNPRYNFWNRTYIRCAPEIEKLFDTVSRSIGGSRGADDGMVSGGLSDHDGGH